MAATVPAAAVPVESSAHQSRAVLVFQSATLEIFDHAAVRGFFQKSHPREG